MGPFGNVINMIGYNLFSDALPLLPWFVLFSSMSLLINKEQTLSRYFFSLIGLLISFLTFVDSFFVHKTTRVLIAWGYRWFI